jgi:hypothetical protein
VIVRHAVEADPRPAERGGSLTGPVQQAASQSLAGPRAANREVVDVDTVVLDDVRPDVATA